MRIAWWTHPTGVMKAELRLTRGGVQIVAIDWNPRDQWHDANQLTFPWPVVDKIWCHHCGHRWSKHRKEWDGCGLDDCPIAPPKWIRENRPPKKSGSNFQLNPLGRESDEQGG